MDIHIDWLSFTLEEGRQPHSIYDLLQLANGRINKNHESLGKEIFNGLDWTAGPGRPPYAYALARQDNGAFVYGGSHTRTILYELSGRGCEFLREGLQPLRDDDYFYERVTRIDLACDVLTDTRPSDFCAERSTQRFRTTGDIRSDSGETTYIGSPKSDRLCRVYRYHKPHPRSGLLRIEFVFRRGMAERAVQELVAAENAAQFVAAAGNTYGFTHPDWRPGVETEERLTGRIIKKSQDGTIGWLYKQVVPAMRRLMREGALDMTEFLEHVYREDGEPQ